MDWSYRIEFLRAPASEQVGTYLPILSHGPSTRSLVWSSKDWVEAGEHRNIPCWSTHGAFSEKPRPEDMTGELALNQSHWSDSHPPKASGKSLDHPRSRNPGARLKSKENSKETQSLSFKL